MVDVHVDVETVFDRLRGLNEERVRVGNDRAEGVRDAAVGEADVGPFFEDGDGRIFVEAARACGRGHAAGDTADNDEDALGGGGHFGGRG